MSPVGAALPIAKKLVWARIFVSKRRALARDAAISSATFTHNASLNMYMKSMLLVVMP
jgi:hypothetical protein